MSELPLFSFVHLTLIKPFYSKLHKESGLPYYLLFIMVDEVDYNLTTISILSLYRWVNIFQVQCWEQKDTLLLFLQSSYLKAQI